MGIFGRKRETARPDRLSPEALAQFGRYKFLGQEIVGPFDEFEMVKPVVGDLYPQDTDAYASVVEEVTRHASTGEWERVGGWKFAREYLAGEHHLVDEGLGALLRMRVTNLAIHLAPIDTRRFQEKFGTEIPNDGFFGPPVFDSDFGPSKQYYFDDAVAHQARRSIKRLPSQPGVEPGELTDAARSLWDVGKLIYCGPLLVQPAMRVEQAVAAPAVAAASSVDHSLFVEQLVPVVMDPDQYLGAYGAIGAARFVEDYLDPSSVDLRAYKELVDHALRELMPMLGQTVSAELLTFRQRAHLESLEAQ